jgi:hypothetical protein
VTQEELTAKRRAEPREFLREVLKLWMDNTPDDALALWKGRLLAGGSFAKDALEILDKTIADPPPDLIELMKENGWLHLIHEDEDGEETPFTFDEHVAWLREQTERLRAAFQEHAT